MKTTVPDTLTADLPPTRWGKILSATPVVMTVVATLLAGLSSSEMTRAQYDRSLAAQLQAKAGDQWSFFQAKRLRGALQSNTLDVIGSLGEMQPLDEAALRQALGGPAMDPGTLAMAISGKWPAMGEATVTDAAVRDALAALEASRPESEINELMAKVEKPALDAALRNARARALAVEAATKPITQGIDELEKKLQQSSASAPLRRSFTAARLNHQARRYEAESRANQVIGTLYELQVRQSNLSAERHHRRSEKFFYGMLAAQAGVIVSTLAMAARQRNLLWSLAAAAGVAAVALALYVYLYI